MTPEIAVHGFPADNFTRSGSRGINLSRLSLGVELNEPSTSNWTSGTSVKFEVDIYPNPVVGLPLVIFIFFLSFLQVHLIISVALFVQHIRPVNNEGRSIARDHDGFPLTCRC
jgi:hypothetical protein